MQFIIFLTIFSSAFAMAGANTGFFPQIFDESKLAQFPKIDFHFSPRAFHAKIYRLWGWRGAG